MQRRHPGGEGQHRSEHRDSGDPAGLQNEQKSGRSHGLDVKVRRNPALDRVQIGLSASRTQSFSDLRLPLETLVAVELDATTFI